MDAKESLVHVIVVVSGTDTWLQKSITVQYNTNTEQTNKQTKSKVQKTVRPQSSSQVQFESES
jgi:cytoskeletal protein RodZ